MLHNALIKAIIKIYIRNFSINSSHTVIIYLDASHITMTTCHCCSFTGSAASALWSVAFSPI